MIVQLMNSVLCLIIVYIKEKEKKIKWHVFLTEADVLLQQLKSVLADFNTLTKHMESIRVQN